MPSAIRLAGLISMSATEAIDAAPRRELTRRALATGAVLGALLAPCNVYSGLKIGFSFNMSITALLLAYMFWIPLSRWLRLHEWTMHESNINQTTASSAASIISGGLVAPIPALALLNGTTFDWLTLSAWVFAVSFLGVWVGWYLRPSLIVRSKLAFPAGVATAETLKDIFAHGREAALRVRFLLGSLAVAAGINAIDKLLWAIPRWAPTATAKKLTFALDPSLLMLGFGAIIGLRSGIGLLLGAIIAWGVLAPLVIEAGWVVVSGDNWFQLLVEWLLWPGVTLMVTASIVGFVISAWQAYSKRTDNAQADSAQTGSAQTGSEQAGSGSQDEASAGSDTVDAAAEVRESTQGQLSRFGAFSVAAAIAVTLQIALFDIHWTMACLAIPLAFALATVAARVTGETGIPPIGAIGKVSQLSFGIMAPGQAVTNLMTANVAGGAAGQSADLLNDLRAGHLIGARPGAQIAAQCIGVLIGSLVGSAVYLALITDPATQLLTPEWPAPAVATWKAVAETLSLGVGGIELNARWAMLIAALLGVALALIESRCSAQVLVWVPSGATVGLAFVIPAGLSITLFVGALLAAVLHRVAPQWSRRFVLAIAAGLVAGESLFGVLSVWLV